VGIHALGRELGDRATARLAALLALVSPFLLLMSAGFMSHAGCLTAVTFFLVFYFRLCGSCRWRDGVLAWCGKTVA
jgi:4-amino-4-deoxy-L-arabinose transferase-like glycosyltransferase